MKKTIDIDHIRLASAHYNKLPLGKGKGWHLGIPPRPRIAGSAGALKPKNKSEHYLETMKKLESKLKENGGIPYFPKTRTLQVAATRQPGLHKKGK